MRTIPEITRMVLGRNVCLGIPETRVTVLGARHLPDTGLPRTVMPRPRNQLSPGCL